MKTCSKCRIEKDSSEFPLRKGGLGKKTRLGSWCWPCKREYANYAYHAKIGQGDRRKALDKSVAAGRAYIRHYRCTHPCVDCGNDNPVVLEFDHVGTKKRDVSRMRRYSVSAIRAEIEECEVVCANCHRIRTAKRGGWDIGYLAWSGDVCDEF